MRKILVVLVIIVSLFFYACQSKQQIPRLEDVENPWVAVAVIDTPMFSDSDIGLYSLVLAYDGRNLKKTLYPTGAIVTVDDDLVAIDSFSGYFLDVPQEDEATLNQWTTLSWSQLGTVIPFVEPTSETLDHQISEEFERIYGIDANRITIYNYQLLTDDIGNETVNEIYYSFDLREPRNQQTPQVVEIDSLVPTTERLINLDGEYSLTVNALGQLLLIKGTRNPVVVDTLYQMGLNETIKELYTLPIQDYESVVVPNLELQSSNSFLWDSHRRMYSASEFAAMDRDSLDSALEEISRRYGLENSENFSDYNRVEMHNIQLIMRHIEAKEGQLYDFTDSGDYVWVELMSQPDSQQGRLIIDDVSLTLPELTGTESFNIVKNSENQTRIIVSYYGEKPSENGTYILNWDGEKREIGVSAKIPGIIYKDQKGTLKRDVYIDWPEGLLATTDFYLVTDDSIEQTISEQTIFRVSSFHYVKNDFEMPSVDQADILVSFKKGEEVEFVATDGVQWVRVMKRNGQIVKIERLALDLFD